MTLFRSSLSTSPSNLCDFNANVVQKNIKFNKNHLTMSDFDQNVDAVSKQLPTFETEFDFRLVMSNDVTFQLVCRDNVLTVSPSGGVGRKYMFQIDMQTSPPTFLRSNTFVAPDPGTMNLKFTNTLVAHGRGITIYNDYGPIVMKCTIKMEKVSEEKTVKISNCNLSNDFGTLLNDKKFSDVTIVTSDGHKIPAHKSILSARSHVFAAMFDHDMLENQLNCVNIKDFNQKVIMEMLRYMYTGEVLCLEDIAKDLVVAADKYELDGLKAMCLQSLSNNLSKETAATVLKLADLYEDNVLKLKTVQFIKENAESVARTPNWKSLFSTDKELIMKEFLQPKALIPIDAMDTENANN